MKKALLIVLSAVGLFSSNLVSAQSFTADKDTVKATIYYGSADLKNKITNTSPSTYKLKWKIVSHTFPANWVSSGFGICDNETCLTFNDEATMYGVKETLDMGPGEHFDLKLQADVYKYASGGPYYMTINLLEGATSKNVVYEITNRFATGVNSLGNKTAEDIIMYPNPARGELNVIYNGSASIKNISVYNLIGKVVNVYKVTSNNNASLDISSIPSGIYFIRLVDAQGRVIATRKFTHQ